jgi:hypothetical protein
MLMASDCGGSLVSGKVLLRRELKNVPCAVGIIMSYPSSRGTGVSVSAGSASTRAGG